MVIYTNLGEYIHVHKIEEYIILGDETNMHWFNYRHVGRN